MKTITLTEDAYRRLREWKDEPGDSFSRVVLKVVPERGTLGQMVGDVGQLPSLSQAHARVMEDAVQWGRDPGALRDSWTS